MNESNSITNHAASNAVAEPGVTGKYIITGERRAHVVPGAGDGVDEIVALVNTAETALGETGTVGIATPGAISRAPARNAGRIKNANSTCLNGLPLVEDLQTLLGREVRIENDANCFALSEATDGAAAGAANVFGVILGTGTGGGICINGRIVTGANAIGGEWGHNPLPWPKANELPGHTCYCGRHGCIETWLSGPGVVCPYSYRGKATSSRRENKPLLLGKMVRFSQLSHSYFFGAGN